MARSVHRTALRSKLLVLLVGGSLGATAVAGCSHSSSGSSGGNSSSAKVVTDGTFNFGLAADPGNLDPQASAASNLYQMSFLAYDELLSIDADGKIQSQLATAWKSQGKQVTLTLHPGITCSDGSAFTAQTAADNINYLANPNNKSPFTGVFLPAGSKGAATGDTLTITLPAPAPFILNGLAGIPMVCAKGLTNRKLLATKTDGTGSYALTEAVSNDHYTLARRSGYSWGPNGATTATAGLPAKIVVKIVPNESTAANLLLAGQLNAVAIAGADSQRLTAAKLFNVGTPSVIGEMWLNQAKGRPAADPKVRVALAKAVDFGQIEKVLTSGRGEPGTSLAATAPVACPGDSVSKALPSHDLDAAKALLDQAGWTVGSDGVRAKGGQKLALKFVYNAQSGPSGAAAAELAGQQWKQLGADVTLKSEDETAAVTTLFSTGDWDIAWEPVNVSSPDQVVGFLSGNPPPNGQNFAHIDNTAYNSGVVQAEKLDGSSGCSQWLAAEANLISAADVIPFANQVLKIFGKGAQFQVAGELQPTSIRMTS